MNTTNTAGQDTAGLQAFSYLATAAADWYCERSDKPFVLESEQAIAKATWELAKAARLYQRAGPGTDLWHWFFKAFRVLEDAVDNWRFERELQGKPFLERTEQALAEASRLYQQFSAEVFERDMARRIKEGATLEEAIDDMVAEGRALRPTAN